MKNKSITAYTAIIAAIFVLAVLFFAFSLFREYRYGHERTGILFDHLVTGVRNAAERYPDNSPEFRTAIDSAIGERENYGSLIITKDGSTLFAYPAGIQELLPTSSLSRLRTTEFTAESGQYTISAGMYLLRPTLLFSVARFSFILALVGTVCAIILLCYLYFFPLPLANDEQASDDDGAELDTAESSAAPLPPDNPYAMASSIRPAVSRETTAQTAEQPVDNAGATVPVSPDADSADGSPAEPLGLFSPLTGFGWEQYLETRLDSELIRATASEYDLALFIIRIPGLDFTAPPTAAVCEYLQQQFQYTDLLFEYHSDGFAAIRSDIAIDTAIETAEQIHAELTKRIAADGYTCFIGLSTRAVRIMSGSRLIREATEAVAHAEAEKNAPIIAFCANNDKYRECIEKEK